MALYEMLLKYYVYAAWLLNEHYTVVIDDHIIL